MLLSSFQHSPLETTAQMPALRAAYSSPSKFNIVNMIIGTVGSEADIHFAASIPLMSGMARSSKTRSGFNSLNFLTPDHPLSASPHTVQRRERTMTPRMRRVTSESSTIKIRREDDISAPMMSLAQRGRGEPRCGTVHLLRSHHGDRFMSIRQSSAFSVGLLPDSRVRGRNRVWCPKRKPYAQNE